MADNEFIIDTTLDTKNAENNAENLNKKIKDMTKDIEKMSDKQKLAFQKSADSYNKTARAVENQKAKLEKLIEKMEQMKNTEVPTKEYTDIQNQIDKANEKLSKLTEQQELFVDNGGKKNSQTYKRRQAEIEQLIKTIEYAKTEQQQLIDEGGATQKADTSDIERQIEDAKIRLQELENELNNKGLDLNIKLDAVKSKSLFAKFFSDVKTLATKSANTMKNVFSKSFSGIKKISVSVFNSIKSGISNVINAFKNPKQLSKPFDVGFKKIMKYGLGVRSVFALVNKLRNALSEGVKNLANFNNGSNKTNQSMTMLKSSLTQLKNSFASAFSPILSYVIPVISKLCAWLSDLATKIGMVLAKLGGASKFTKAKKVVDNYADAVGNANNKLASFDELNTLDSDSGGGGLSANDMFEEVDIEDGIDDIVADLKDAWDYADFSYIGEDIGKNLLANLKNIPWSDIQEQASKIGQSLATLLNGVFKTDGLGYEIGNTIAQAINTGLNFANSFLKSFDFSAFGKFIGDGINGALLNIDWNMMGENFALKLNGITTTIKTAVQTIKWNEIATSMANGVNTAISNIDAKNIGETFGEVLKNAFGGMSTFIQEINWYELGTKVQECICSVDWNGVADAFFETLGSAFGGLASFLWGIIEQAMTDLATWWYDNAFENGKFSITGLLDGILNALVNIATWIYEHIFTPFKEGFCKAFKINSPSKFMSEMGEYIMQGLLDGIDGMIEDFKKIWEDLKTIVLDIFENLWQGLKGIINSIIGGIESMANGVVNGINAIIDVLNNLHVEIPDWIPKFGGKTIGFNISHMNEISLPKLATGTVVPRQASEFMAIMGDNNKETEVVSPLSTIKQALSEVMSENGNNSGDVYISAEGDLDALVRLLKLKIDDEGNRVGRSFTRVMA